MQSVHNVQRDQIYGLARIINVTETLNMFSVHWDIFFCKRQYGCGMTFNVRRQSFQ